MSINITRLIRINARYLPNAAQVFDEIPQRSKFQLPKYFSNKPLRAAKVKKPREVLNHFYLTNRSGAEVTKFVLCSALNSCAKIGRFSLGVQVHGHVVKKGYADNLFLNSALVDLYAKCGFILCAKRVFYGMERHDEVSWTSIISGLSKAGESGEAVWMFNGMLRSKVKPNCVTYVSVISSCKEIMGGDIVGMVFHGHVVKFGFDGNSFVVSSLIDCYSKCGGIDLALRLFGECEERDDVVYNSIISGCSQNLYSEEALRFFLEMRKDDLSPTDHTFASILNACGSLTGLELGKELHCLVTKVGSDRNLFVASALIDMYSKCGSIYEARCVFDQAADKNSVLWTSLITGYAQSSKEAEALELFDRYIEEGFAPDHVCFTAVLTACNHAGFFDKGIECFNRITWDYGLLPDVDQYACLIDLYAKNGHLEKAKQLMDDMPFDANHVILSSFLSSCNKYGEVELGKIAADQLFKAEPKNAAPYIALAQLYAKAGLWAEAAGVRKRMRNKRVRKSAGRSWIEVDKVVNVFTVGDACHPQSQEIYTELYSLNQEIKEAGYMARLKNQSCIVS